MGQSGSKEMNCSRQRRDQSYGQSLASSSRASTSSCDSWGSYPALIPSQASAANLKIKGGDDVACRFFRVFGYLKKKVARKESLENDKTERIASVSSGYDVASSRVYPPVVSLDELVRCTKFSRDELQQMYKGFKNDCPAGEIDRETFKEKYADLFPEADSSFYANVIFNTFDTNKDGRITFEDFVVGLSETIHSNLDQKLKWTFRLYDVNGDGILTKEELVKVLDAVYKTLASEYPAGYKIPSKFISGGAQMRNHVDTLFHALDQSENGLVTEEDFVEACMKDRYVLKHLAVANQFASLIDDTDDDVSQANVFVCPYTSSTQGPEAISLDFSPTLICRDLNRIQSLSHFGQQLPTSSKKEDLELLEFRHKRGRCGTN